MQERSIVTGMLALNHSTTGSAHIEEIPESATMNRARNGEMYRSYQSVLASLSEIR
jgi:hypothetical protein